ncbi:uncharacterized protein LAJ45_06422 [Morchella importuna]|uniref:uncharacterized protein n=1 Tax=Morchella importuna TaxID=1174673 RepID=UPI001E8D2FA4|nr:uncharacterized protein LAJ45_06422 [Morchella importuna]KAH8149343.1 hypothetical protein LAJ45_06422 [Morchella importuna]
MATLLAILHIPLSPTPWNLLQCTNVLYLEMSEEYTFCGPCPEAKGINQKISGRLFSGISFRSSFRTKASTARSSSHSYGDIKSSTCARHAIQCFVTLEKTSKGKAWRIALFSPRESTKVSRLIISQDTCSFYQPSKINFSFEHDSERSSLGNGIELTTHSRAEWNCLDMAT